MSGWKYSTITQYVQLYFNLFRITPPMQYYSASSKLLRLFRFTQPVQNYAICSVYLGMSGITRSVQCSVLNQFIIIQSFLILPFIHSKAWGFSHTCIVVQYHMQKASVVSLLDLFSITKSVQDIQTAQSYPQPVQSYPNYS
jgi:hypothetical protein